MKMKRISESIGVTKKRQKRPKSGSSLDPGQQVQGSEVDQPAELVKLDNDEERMGPLDN